MASAVESQQFKIPLPETTKHSESEVSTKIVENDVHPSTHIVTEETAIISEENKSTTEVPTEANLHNPPSEPSEADLHNPSTEPSDPVVNDEVTAPTAPLVVPLPPLPPTQPNSDSNEPITSDETPHETHLPSTLEQPLTETAKDDNTKTEVENTEKEKVEEKVEEEIFNEEDLRGSKKLLKKITKKGKAWGSPSIGADVVVHYDASLVDGTVFYNSRESGPVTFKVGGGDVPEALEIVVKTMKKAEQCLITAASEYTRGIQSLPVEHTEDLVIKFNMELISWTEWRDVAEWKGPKMVSVVNLDWKLTLQNSQEILEEKKDATVTIGAEEVIDGLDIALLNVKKGEHALIRLNPAVAYGDKGNENPKIPPNSTLIYEVHIKDFTVIPKAWTLTGPQKIERATQLKVEGGKLFSDNKLRRAQRKYMMALDIVVSDSDMDPKTKLESHNLKVVLYSNLAACDIKQKRWDDAIEHASRVLSLQPNNTKALLRRGKAYRELDKWNEAKSDLIQVLETQGAPEIPEARNELKVLNEKIKAQDDRDRKLYSNMFAKKEAAPAPPSKSGKSTTSSKLSGKPSSSLMSWFSGAKLFSTIYKYFGFLWRYPYSLIRGGSSRKSIGDISTK
eukprot:NODE_1330_length_2008_cov_55.236605_g1026_i1.p1 GENE.NODE_1330_length_2008_cov_55.236605_g1026_i1~~NODE_1330_length_2008_cov_55.236605_g1026_i1.p1  ORF type:complete len:621 (+),score=155.77 NODE_1330_length_2008_cov_55.236605_g1026_i1:86-1948(+)